MSDTDPLLSDVIAKMVGALNDQDVKDLYLLFDVQLDEVVEALMRAVAEREGRLRYGN